MEIDKTAAVRVLFFTILALVTLVSVTAAFLLLKKNPDKVFGNKLMKAFSDHQGYLLLFFIVLFVVCVTSSTYYFSDRFLPFPAAEPQTRIVPLFNTTTILTGIAFFLTQILLFFFAFRFRSRKKSKAEYITGWLKLELLWTAVPAVTFIFLFVWGQILWKKITDFPGSDALTIEVVAEQFNWRVRYGGADHKLGRADFRLISDANVVGLDMSDPASKDDFIPIQMHVPKGRPVEIHLRSKDVIHSFFIPYFRAKMDALPGMITRLHFTPTTTTNEMRRKLNDPEFDYEVACAELCGRMHFGMKMIVVVDEPKTFDAWYAAQQSINKRTITTAANDDQ